MNYNVFALDEFKKNTKKLSKKYKNIKLDILELVNQLESDTHNIGVHLVAFGCGENIIPFRVFKLISALKIAVDVGFVVGTTPAIIPIGSANFRTP